MPTLRIPNKIFVGSWYNEVLKKKFRWKKFSKN